MMEFRQVLHQVCRTAAAAARPSLASTRQITPSTLLLQQRRNFNSGGSNQSQEAAASQRPHRPLHASPSRAPSPLVSPQHAPLQPPRPKFVRKTKSIEESQTSSRLLKWTAPPGHRVRSTGLTGRAATSPGAGGTADIFGANADMRNATAGMANWQPDEFLPAREETVMRLSPSTGRTVLVNKSNVDVARAFRLLQTAMNRNRVKREVRLQSFHERPALKRKRKLRERWQVRFKQGFVGVLDRVRELKGQGW